MDIPTGLIASVKENKCAIFIGAGLSIRAGYPSWKALLEQLIAKAAEQERSTPDTAKELKEHLKNPSDYLMVAEELSDKMDRIFFREELAHIFAEHRPPTKAHCTIATIPFSLAITTNYDRLLENAYAQVHQKIPDTYTYEDARDFADRLWSGTFFILKAHGTANRRDSMVITERDYRTIINRALGYRAIITSIFTTKTVLFLGVSFSDPETRLLLSFLHDAFYGSAPKHYALVPRPYMSNTAANRWYKDFRIHCIQYNPSDGTHPEIDVFLDELKSATA